MSSFRLAVVLLRVTPLCCYPPLHVKDRHSSLVTMHWNVCGMWKSYDAYICVYSVVYHQGSYNANWPMDIIAMVLELLLCCLDDDLIYMYKYIYMQFAEYIVYVTGNTLFYSFLRRHRENGKSWQCAMTYLTKSLWNVTV